LKSASLADYKGLAFDKEAMITSFFMSNMSPQSPSSNRGAWKKFEVQFRDWARVNDFLCFIIGPVLALGLAKISSDEVSVRERYYKIALDRDRSNQAAKALLFLKREINDKLENHIVIIDRVEKLARIT
jgi:endonuclease G